MNLISRDELIDIVSHVSNQYEVSVPISEMSRESYMRWLADALLAIGHFERHEFVPTVKVVDNGMVTFDDMTLQCKCGQEEP